MGSNNRSRSDRRRASRRRPWPIRILRLVLTVMTTVSSVALVGVVVGQLTHQFRLAPVLSGSMSPDIPTGSLVEAEPVRTSSLEPGDILLFNAPIDGKPLVMHRIYAETEQDGAPVFTTKGDANDAPDAWSIRVRGPVAWRVRHTLPYLGTVIGWLGQVGARMIVLIGGISLLLLWGLRAVWGRAPISWQARDPRGVVRERRRRRTNRRSFTLAGVGTIGVLALATAGLAGAQFTATPTPPLPAVGSGTLGAPSTLTCRWTSTTALRLDWTDTSPSFTTGYNILRSNTSGSGYTSVGTASPQSNRTFSNSPPTPVTTQRYYVVDSTRSTWSSAHSNQVQNSTCIQAVNLVAGTSQGFSGDGGQATAAQLADPQDAAVDSSGNVYIADTTNNRVRKIDGSTGVITTIAGGGASTGCAFSGAATSATLSGPRGVAVDSSTGDVYISDTGNNCIRKVSGGNISLFAGTGATTACTYSGSPTGVSLSAPSGLQIDSSGTLFITDTTRRCIRKVSGGTMSQVAGAGTGTASACTFSGAATTVILSTTADDVAVDSSGNVYIADSGSACIRKVAGGNVSQFAGGGANSACTYAGAATAVSLSAPGGVAVDSSGRVVIADTSRRCVRIVDTSGNVSQVAGTGSSGSTGDGGPAVAALFNAPSDVTANASGNIWIADTGTDRVRRVQGPL